MKVIFQQDVRGQGKKGEMKEVSEGYARNYLIPRKMAVEATRDNMNALALYWRSQNPCSAKDACTGSRFVLNLVPYGRR